METAYLCDGTRTPIGRYGGALSGIRADDLAAIPLNALMKKNSSLSSAAIDDVIFGCANQAGEDNRNVARMAVLLSGMSENVPASTINRLCGSGLNAVSIAANAITATEADVVVAGGAESMTRAPFVIGKSAHAFARNQQLEDTTMGWRFINPRLEAQYGVDTMPQTAETLAKLYNIDRSEQDHFSLLSQEKAKIAIENGYLATEITPVEITAKNGTITYFKQDEHPRNTSLEKLAKLNPLFEKGTVTAGNASGINDGAAAIILASERGCAENSLKPRAKLLGSAVAGVAPKKMGIGPVFAVQKLLTRLGLTLNDFDIIELNEAFAAQALACLKDFDIAMDDPRLNPWGGAIALGHPLGMSGVRLVITALNQLERSGGKRALCTMCIGVGQGIALAIETIN